MMDQDRDEAQSHMLRMVAAWLAENMDNNTDITNKIREPLQYIYPLFIFLHAIVAVCGISGNILILVNVVRYRLYTDSTCFFICNLAISDIIKALFVMPMTLTNLLIKHWVFGSFLCYFIPMLQSFPVYVSMITFLVIAIDRYRLIMYPMKTRIPPALTMIGTWILSICIVLPQAIYLQYFDLAQVSPKFDGLGICLVSIEKNYEEYVRSMFVILYAMPLACIAFLYIRSSAELKALYHDSVAQYRPGLMEEPVSQAVSETSYHSKITYTNWSSANAEHVNDRMEPEGASTSNQYHESALTTSSYNDGDLNIHKEKITQKYMITMISVFAACWCPLNILYLVTPFIVPEEHEAQMDITFITFSWIGFLSTCSNPILFASWRMSSGTRDRLRGYFNRRCSSESSAKHLRTRTSTTPSRSDERAIL